MFGYSLFPSNWLSKQMAMGLPGKGLKESLPYLFAVSFLLETWSLLNSGYLGLKTAQV